MTALRVLVVDDEALARRQLRRFLDPVPGVSVVGECASGEEAVESIVRLTPGLVFLDVEMPHLDGFEVIDAVGADRMPPVVFVTAYDAYAVRAFRAHALDYLLKPVDPALVAEAVARARRSPDESGAEPLARRLAAVLDAHPARPSYLRRLLVRDDGRTRVVPVEQVDWLEADDNLVRLHMRGGTRTVRATIAGLAARLDPARFARIHRSTIVNLDRVREIQPWFRGEYALLLEGGTRLTIGATFRESFLAALRGVGER